MAKKITVELRHKTPYKHYRRAGLTLTAIFAVYMVSEEQLDLLEGDPWVETKADDQGANAQAPPSSGETPEALPDGVKSAKGGGGWWSFSRNGVEFGKVQGGATELEAWAKFTAEQKGEE